MLSLRRMPELTPFAQVVVYTVLPDGEAVADSQDFPIQLCLKNKVGNSVSFASHMRCQNVSSESLSHVDKLGQHVHYNRFPK